MKVLCIVSPDELGIRTAQTAAKISKKISLLYSTQAESPELEKWLKLEGCETKTFFEKGSIVSDAIRIALLENVDLICVPKKFTDKIKGMSEATKNLVETAPISVLVVK